ncbi:phosphoribosylglycinamide formyltransferase [Legionella sp.]|uniref:phosphoribosylglycinamide formyltransferase n=1 Tax=Legionella sp. TaxID=459 RepID=UPI003CC2D181
MLNPLRLALLGSSNGTNMLHLIEAIKQQHVNASIEVVLSNKADAPILARARDNNLKAICLDNINKTRETFDTTLSETLQKFNIDLIILIGYMRILSPLFVATWQNRIINVHPSLLPAFSGMMDRKVHEAVLAAGVNESGCTVHFVTEVIDSGPIIIQKTCSVGADDTVDTLKAKVQSLEGEALIEAIQKIKKVYYESNYQASINFCCQ